MLVIGEKINGTLKKIATAISARDAAFIQDMARRQVEAGAHYLDVNAGTPPHREPDDLIWLIETVQTVVDVPLCLDSANPFALKAGIERVKQKPMVNSVSGEASRLQNILPLVAEHKCPVIALLLDDKGIPHGVEGRLDIARRIIELNRQAGMRDEDLFADPLAMALSAKIDGGTIALETMGALRAEYPSLRFIVGLSNISFGLPARSLVNQAFLAQALAAGLDAAIIDPLDKRLSSMLLATELVLGRDRFCRNYTRAYRAGKIKG
jgi:5-methyltetrahydrofolate--homocysteine methyltransferase